MDVALAIATIVFAIFSLLPLTRIEGWWVRIFDFPRMQIATGIVVLIILQLSLLDISRSFTWFLFAVALACLIYQSWWIVRYSPLYPLEVKSTKNGDGKNKIRIMAANVLTSNRNYKKLLGLVRCYQPDILVTVETDTWWQQKLDALEPDYPHTVKCPLDNLYGMHVYSRLPLKNTEIKYLVEDDKPSIHALAELPSGRGVRMHFLHPGPPSPTENEESSERDAELLVLAKSISQCDPETPVIVTGDLNDVAWSRTTRTFRKISGLLDPRIGRGMFNTFHAEYWFLRWPLDHLFHSSHFTLGDIHRLQGIGSDHFPLLVELCWEGNTGQDNELEPTEDDRRWLKLKQQDEDVSPKDVPNPEKTCPAL